MSIAIRVEADPGLPPLLADKAQLETVLVNLAVNARDAMPEGGSLTAAARPVVIVKSQAHPAALGPGAYLRLDLVDTGVGMDAATLARASEPFFTTKSPGQGTGLAMARGFAEQSGGGFAIRSAPGQGTRVTLWFPQAECAGPSADGPAQAAAVASAAAHVLVVDDDAMVRTVLAGQLEALGYRVAQASDGLAALARLNAGKKVDLLVTDLSMPGMNGLVLIEEARRRRPGLPIMLLTGFADASVRLSIEAAQDRAMILLRKPISGDELAELRRHC